MSAASTPSSLTISELREFAAFTPSEQGYIRRSLDIALGRPNALKRITNDPHEIVTLRTHREEYRAIAQLRQATPTAGKLDGLDSYMGGLLRLTVFDLAQEKLNNFSSYRFLYERLLGAASRPWLPSAFCGAAAMPNIRPDRRRVLLRSISEAAATAPGWSSREPVFYPEWVCKDVA